MMRWLRRFRWWLSMWTSPDLDFREDYETLIRLARRCAYDMKHMADYVGREHAWMPEIAWAARAGSWVGLFAKGNPGKDYRSQLSHDLAMAEMAIERLIALCEEHKVPIPHDIDESFRRPF